MFKKVATLQFKKIYASDNNKDYYWRDFVKQANDKLATDSTFVPKNFYEYNTDKFLYLTARAISGMEKWGPNGNYDAFPWEELKRSYPTFCGKGFYIEHKEDDEKDAKGIILDAQPDDDNEFINCICAISKEEYPDICEQILNGQLNQVSMSCLAGTCGCSLCGNEATKEEELCEHMNPKHPNFCKGQIGSNGQPIYEINKDIMFTGLSGVAVPADKDAFIFDVKASKKSKTSIDKEYNKYLRAKKEYEYINSLLEKEDTRKYIESKLEKKASKFIIRDVESGMYFNNDDLVESQNEAQIFNTREEAENEIDKRMHKIINKMQDKERKLEPINSEDYYDVVQITASLNKKADVEYMSDTIKEIPPIDFETEFMNAGKSKGCNSDINKDQLELGIKVEMEHTTNPVIAEKIACDHIKEIPNYYTLLAEMEASAKARFEEAKHVVNKETNEEFPTKLASKQFFKIKKSSKQFFKVKKAEDININNIDSYKAFELIKNKTVTKDNNELYNKLINIIINDKESYYATRLLGADIITKQDNEYNTIINKIIDSGDGDYLIKHNYITRKDGELYNKALDKFLDRVKRYPYYMDQVYDWIKNKIITKEDGNLFYKALSIVCELDKVYREEGDNEPTDILIYDGIITKEDIEKAKQFSKQSSKQFFKVNKANKNWFKIANIYDDPEERNNIDNYGLSELQRKELQNVIDHIDIVNEDIVVTWDELIESVNQDILDYDFMNKNKVNIIDYIEKELGQEIEVY